MNEPTPPDPRAVQLADRLGELFGALGKRCRDSATGQAGTCTAVMVTMGGEHMALIESASQVQGLQRDWFDIKRVEVRDDPTATAFGATPR